MKALLVKLKLLDAGRDYANSSDVSKDIRQVNKPILESKLKSMLFKSGSKLSVKEYMKLNRSAKNKEEFFNKAFKHSDKVDIDRMKLLTQMYMDIKLPDEKYKEKYEDSGEIC